VASSTRCCGRSTWKRPSTIGSTGAMRWADFPTRSGSGVEQLPTPSRCQEVVLDQTPRKALWAARAVTAGVSGCMSYPSVEREASQPNPRNGSAVGHGGVNRRD